MPDAVPDPGNSAGKRQAKFLLLWGLYSNRGGRKPGKNSVVTGMVGSHSREEHSRVTERDARVD